jgi:hypothetical protein
MPYLSLYMLLFSLNCILRIVSYYMFVRTKNWLDVYYKVHDDELVREADVRNQFGVFRRAVRKLCPLPIDAV